MTTYYKQYITEEADALRQGRLGRKLRDTGETRRPFAHYAEQRRPNEQVYALLSGGFKPDTIVVKVTTESEYNIFYGQYRSGMFTSIDFYAVPNGLVID